VDAANHAALLPVENSIAGSIARSYDLLWEYRLHAIAETAFPVEMNLIGRSIPTKPASARFAHPVALEQIHACGTHPAWKACVADTAARRGDRCARDPTIAASVHTSGELYAEKCCAPASKTTRQLQALLSCHARAESARHARLRRNRSREPSRHATRRALAFADRGLDLRSLVARPNHVDPFHYRFFFEIGKSIARASTRVGRARRPSRSSASSRANRSSANIFFPPTRFANERARLSTA